MKNKKASSEHHLTFAKNRYRDKHAPPLFNTVKPQIGWKWMNKERKIRIQIIATLEYV
jgi:hypothetical protein